MLKVGVAIPCYIYHLPKLRFLLESIAKQTVKPDYVVVSCSSTKSDNVEVQQLLSTYSQKFTLTILTTQERKNAAENRNIASRYLLELQIDIISYIDADDVMYQIRTEYIKYVFLNTDALFVLHSFIEETDSDDSYDIPTKIDPSFISYNKLVRCESGCSRHIENNNTKRHHAQCSIYSKIFEKIQYREEDEFTRREDSVFCGDVLRLIGSRNVYISVPLSLYRKEGKTVDVD